MRIQLSAGKRALARWLALAVLVLPWPAQALTINPVYDSSVTSLPNAAQVEAAYVVAMQTLEHLYTNPITVNITVKWGNTSLGSSGDSLVGHPTYAQLTNALRKARTTAADSNAVASLPAGNPIGTNVWWIPRAEAKALGLDGVNPKDSTIDGSVTFQSNVNWTFDPTNRAVVGEYDFIGIAQHETTEAIGRCYDLNVNPSGGYVPYDLFRFTGNGARSLNVNDSDVYFSLNDGLTALKYFSNVDVGDPQDWLPTGNPDSFDASLNPDEEAILSSADLTSLSILGYALQFTSPRLTGARLANGNFKISFTNVSGLGFVVLASTNISPTASNWANIGAPIESPAGQYQFIDTQVTSNQTRFFRVSLP